MVKRRHTVEYLHFVKATSKARAIDIVYGDRGCCSPSLNRDRIGRRVDGRCTHVCDTDAFAGEVREENCDTATYESQDDLDNYRKRIKEAKLRNSRQKVEKG
jgi:hypothetical protein